MLLAPYLLFYGDCKAAFDFYCEVFHASSQIITTFEEAPTLKDLPISLETADLVYKGELHFENGGYISTLVLADSPTLLFNRTADSRGIRDNISLLVKLPRSGSISINEVFNQLAIGGKINIKIKEDSSGQLSGSVIDRFGVCWLLEEEIM